MIHVLYHGADFDGVCSAAIVYWFLKSKEKDTELNLIPLNYGDNLEIGIFKKEDIVYMLDFSLEPERMKLIKNLVKNFIWIDHHDAIIKEVSERGYKFAGNQTNEFAACQLTWDFLNWNDERPFVVDILGYYDIWKHDKMDHILEFQEGLKCQSIMDPIDVTWKFLLNFDFYDTMEFVNQIISQGEIILKYKAATDPDLAKRLIFDLTIKEQKFLCINKADCGSKFFCQYLNESHNAQFRFHIIDEKIHGSFYSSRKDFHCGEFAKQLAGNDGGGHKGAGGFNMVLTDFLKLIS